MEFRKILPRTAEMVVECQRQLDIQSFHAPTKKHIQASCQDNDGDDKRFKCPQCGKRFRYQYPYKYHLRLHAGDRPYLCHQCGKRFTRGQDLRQHCRKVHKGEKPCVCEQCHRTFSSKQNLKKHIQNHEMGQLLACDQCDMSFKFNWQLRCHKSTHSNTSPSLPCNKPTKYSYYLRHLLRKGIPPKPVPVVNSAGSLPNLSEVDTAIVEPVMPYYSSNFCSVPLDNTTQNTDANVIVLLTSVQEPPETNSILLNPNSVLPSQFSVVNLVSDFTNDSTLSSQNIQQDSGVISAVVVLPADNTSSFTNNADGNDVVTPKEIQNSFPDTTEHSSPQKAETSTVHFKKPRKKKHKFSSSCPAKTPTDSAEMPFVCPECYSRFGTTDELREHTQLHILDKSFACTLCPKRFSYFHCLESHLATHAISAQC